MLIQTLGLWICMNNIPSLVIVAVCSVFVLDFFFLPLSIDDLWILRSLCC